MWLCIYGDVYHTCIWNKSKKISHWMCLSNSRKDLDGIIGKTFQKLQNYILHISAWNTTMVIYNHMSVLAQSPVSSSWVLSCPSSTVKDPREGTLGGSGDRTQSQQGLLSWLFVMFRLLSHITAEHMSCTVRSPVSIGCSALCWLASGPPNSW